MRWSLLLLCGVLFGASANLQAASVRQLKYTGELVQRDQQGTSFPVRSFSVTAWLSDNGDTTDAIYRVDDEARDALPWWERMGHLKRSGAGVIEGPLPRLRHHHLDRPYTLVIPAPWLSHDGELARGTNWEGTFDGRPLRYLVTGTETVEGREVWNIVGNGNAGRTQTLQIEAASDLIVSVNQRAFIGQGERFELLLKLIDSTELSADISDRVLSASTMLLQLQTDLDLPESAIPPQLSVGQVQRVEARLSELESAAAGTDQERFVRFITSNLTADRRRTAAIQEQADKLLNQPAPSFTLPNLDGQPVNGLAEKKVWTVLHFWDYQGTPASPFGQVAYLDFLAARWKPEEVQVYGIAVDSKAADPQLVKQLRRNVRKFSTEFMRLDYPILLDDGTVLKQYGDPRPAKVSLPLWIVIDPQGNVVHYHAGLYTIDPNRGLEQLKGVVLSEPVMR